MCFNILNIKKMKFNKINHIVVFGGSQLTLEFLKLLKKKKINFHYFTNKRQLLDNNIDYYHYSSNFLGLE